MNYNEVRDIAQDVVDRSTRYSDEEIQGLRNRINDLEDLIFQLANVVNVSIERNRGYTVRPIPQFPETNQLGGIAYSGGSFAPPSNNF